MVVESWETNEEVSTKKRLPTVSKLPLATVFLIILSIGSGFVGGWLGANNRLDNPTSSTQANQRVVSSESQLINSIVKNVSPSVVSIDVTSSANQTDAFGFSQQTQQISAGTGFLVSGNVVITNRHVVPASSSKVSITLSDGTRLTDVSIIGRTAASDPLDVAFLKINDTKGKKLKAVSLGESSKVQVGDKVIAIGNALGQFQNTVTSGIISGHGRSVRAGDSSGNNTETLQDLFQTDAAINEGNSGGPLVDISGNVVGINTAIAGNAQNIGFSIPINDVKGVVKSVLTKGKLIRPFLGVRYVSITDDIASHYKLSVRHGAFVYPAQDGVPSVVAGSPAQKAGIKERDVITEVNGYQVNQDNSLASLLGQYKVGDKVVLTIIRVSTTKSVSVSLAAMPSN